MTDQGAAVVANDTPELDQLRTELGVPMSARSCHTALVDGYVVEGHVPAEAVVRLLEERPEVVGIAVPGMPPESPGMSSDPEEWADLDVFIIGQDGSLTPFEY